MNKNFIRSSIIILIQIIMPMLALLIFTPYLLESKTLDHIQNYLKANQAQFLIWHGLFYIAIFFTWPLSIKNFHQFHQPTEAQIKKINQSRWYLITTLILIDIGMIWSKT